MRFLADMGVDQRIVDSLRTQGHDAVHLREQGLHRAADVDIFAKAIAEDRVVLTFDLDFGEILALVGPRRSASFFFASATRGLLLSNSDSKRCWPPTGLRLRKERS